MQEFLASKADNGQRADVVVATKYPEFTRSSLETLFDKKMVRLGNLPIKPSKKIAAGDKLIIDESYLRIKPLPIKLPIIYEDNDVIVVNKPAGILTHSKGAINFEATVASFIASKINDKAMTGNRAGIVHRLDRATSGVIICAKNLKSLTLLQRQFAKRKTKKTYLAIVEGRVSPPVAIIDVPIERNPKNPRSFKVGAKGRQAQTRYKTIKTFDGPLGSYTYLEVSPITGRTHQIRVHLAYLKHPIVGDNVYGSVGEHLLLHAASLEITLPSKERKRFTAAIPKQFKEFINAHA
ncbi:MAG: RluA family pseudouridine synthase [Candidatus Saccharimonadales bacterium]